MEKGGHRRSSVYEPCEVRWCCTGGAAVVPLLYCADALEIRRELWVGVVARGIQGGTPTYAHTEAPFIAVTKGKHSSTATLVPWLPQDTLTV